MSKEEASTTTGIEPEGASRVGKGGVTEQPDTDAEGHGVRFGRATEEPGIEPDGSMRAGKATEEPGIEPDGSMRAGKATEDPGIEPDGGIKGRGV